MESKTELEVTKSSSTLVVGAVLGLFIAALAILPQIQWPTYD